MVLLLPTVGLLGADSDLLSNVLHDECLKGENVKFLSRKAESPIPSSNRAVCALMGEQALVNFSESSWYVGSTDATTCLIVVVVCRVTCNAWAAHFNSRSAVRDMSIQRVLPQHMQEPEVWLVGSFREDSGESAGTLSSVLKQLHACKLPFRVRLACVDVANTDEAGAPRALHLSLACTADAGCGACGYASPTGFTDRGPELPRRFIQELIADYSDGCLRSIVKTPTAHICIPGLACRRLMRKTGILAYMEKQLQLPHAVFLQGNSTSPDHEPPNFVEDLRAGYRYALNVASQGLMDIPDAWYKWDPRSAAASGLTHASDGATSVSGWKPLVTSDAGNAA